MKVFIVEAAGKLSVSSLPPKANTWLGSCLTGERRAEIKKLVPLQFWQLRDNASIFSLWWKKNAIPSIFFDGASKGNPGIAGAGGLILSSNRSSEFSFSWGLGKCSNNQVECYSLLKACQIAKDIGYKAIEIFRDSELLIKLLNYDDHFSNPALNKSL